MRPTQLITPVCLFAAASSAWPSLWQPVEAVKRELAPLVVRQDATSTKYDLSYSAPQGNTATTVKSSTAETSDASDASTTGTETGSTAKETGKTTGQTTGQTTGTGKTAGSTGSDKSTGKTYASTQTFDARLPAGGVSMITPSPGATTYYKIEDYVTFAWNYTSLSVTPSAVDILAYNGLASATYTLAMNQSITAATQALTWDTGSYQASAVETLLTGTYTLIIHDAAKDVSATAQAGYLGTYEQFTFGMYIPQPYTPIADWVCATCSGAMSSMERQTLGFMFGMVAMTVLSFGWFAGVAGLW